MVSSQAHTPPRTDDALTSRVDRLDEAVDETIPRGRHAGDTDTTPGVDRGVWSLHVEFAQTRSPDVLRRLVDEYDRYALALARRFDRSREPRDDLNQVAREALVVALQRFEPERGLPFPSYATPTITGALRRYYRDNGWALRVPRCIHETTIAARVVVEEWSSTHGRSPTVKEVADRLGISVDDLLEAQEATYARDTVSLDAPLTEAGSGSGGSTMHDLLAGDDDTIDLRDRRMDLIMALRHLDDRDRELLERYYFQECSQTEVARHLGVSQMQVSRLLAATLRRLRTHMSTT